LYWNFLESTAGEAVKLEKGLKKPLKHEKGALRRLFDFKNGLRTLVILFAL
jgi:hypothetical protein